MGGKRVPFSEEAEQSVIGSILIDNDVFGVVSGIITMEDFYLEHFRSTFRAMSELHTAGKEIDVITLQAQLKADGAKKEVSDLIFIKNVLQNTPTSANARSYASIIRELSVKRRMIEAAGAISEMCYAEESAPLEEIMDNAEKRIFEITHDVSSAAGFTPIHNIVIDAMSRIDKISRGESFGIPSGFADIDTRLGGGLMPSDLILVAARPSMGKTAFALNISHHLAVKNDRSVLIFSLEMSKEQLINRFFAMESSVRSQSIRTANMNDHEWEKLSNAARELSESKLIIDDTAGLSVMQMRSRARRYISEYPVSLIVIDYLQLLSGKGENRTQEISKVSRDLKAMAKELDVPVIALSQLSRAVEQRPDHRPMLSDLRDSGEIEQNADVVMFIYRDEYYHKDSEDVGIAEINIAKQRNGPVGCVKLAWIGERTMFADLEVDPDERKIKVTRENIQAARKAGEISRRYRSRKGNANEKEREQDEGFVKADKDEQMVFG